MVEYVCEYTHRYDEVWRGNTMEKRKNKDKSFMRKYGGWLCLAVVILSILYFIIYFCFKGEGFLTAGIDLEKRDWLSFLGSYLAFAGATVVSMVALFQSHFFVAADKEKQKDDRKKQIQPVFSVNIDAVDSHVSGTVETFNMSDLSTLPKHKNITLSIENVGDYPVRNVIIFDKYLFQMLKSNENKVIQIAYDDSPDMKSWRKRLIEIYESEYERTKEGIPRWFNINYDDVDGNAMYQTFELKDFDGTKYYSLEGIHQV